MKKKRNIIIIIVALFIIFLICLIVYKIEQKSNNKSVKYAIQNVVKNQCSLEYKKLCFNIPDDYKCVGNNKCQLVNKQDMLLVQVFLEEDYDGSLEEFVKSDHALYVKFDNPEIKKINERKWFVGKNKYIDEKYYYTKNGDDIYTVRILAKKDSGNKFEELVESIEKSIRMNK